MSDSKTSISRGCRFFFTDEGRLSAKNILGGHKMEVYDWVDKLPAPSNSFPQLVEVRFKNTRKAFYENTPKLPLKKGDIVAVEGTPGVDIGIVSLTSQLLVHKQMKRSNPKLNKSEIKKVLRIAKSVDIERWGEAISREHKTMIGARQLSAELGLDMKIGDVEFQGDGMKAIFYYIADGRVDFRELIKVLFDRFRVRVEMKQIGARQEAGRIGGIGACGRELCCSGWINHFSTIGIGAARAQDISFNPQKLAGQCCKLKCCLNYEVDSYLDAKKSLPRVSSPLEAMDGMYYLIKTNPLTATMYFSPAPNNFSIQIPLSAARVREIQAMNSRGEKPMQIEDDRTLAIKEQKLEPELQNIELEESLTRFDKRGGNKGRNRKRQNNAQKANGDKAVPKAKVGQKQNATQGSQENQKPGEQKTSNPKQGGQKQGGQKQGNQRQGTQQNNQRQGTQQNGQKQGAQQDSQTSARQTPAAQTKGTNDENKNANKNNFRNRNRNNNRKPNNKEGKTSGEQKPKVNEG